MHSSSSNVEPKYYRSSQGVWKANALMALPVILISLLGFSIFQDVAHGPDSKIWLLDVDVERSVYTWYSQLILAATAVYLADTAFKLFFHAKIAGIHWFLLAALFMVLSADEALSIHEMLSGRLSNVIQTSGWFTFAWIIPAGILCSLGLAAATPFLLSIKPKVRYLMVLSAALFLGGAIGMEMVGGNVLSINNGDIADIRYRICVSIEEGLEGIGVLVFLFSHVLYRREYLES